MQNINLLHMITTEDIITLLSVFKQWGTSSSKSRDTQVTYPLNFNTLFTVCGSPKSSSNLTGSQSNFCIKSQSTTGFIANMYDNGSGYAGFNWIAAGK